jgi:hypothetical protein
VRRLWRAGRAIALVSALAAGLVLGGMLGFLAQGQPEEPVAPSPAPSPPRLPPVRVLTPDTLLAWTPGGLPAGFGTAVARLRGVDHVVSVVSGTAWLTRSYSSEGDPVDRPPAGLAIPLEVAAANLRDYAPFLPPGDRALLPNLAGGQAALGATSARLRRAGPGGVLMFGDRRLRIAGILPDAAIGAHEVFLSRAAAATIGVTRDRYLLIDPSPGASRERIAARIRALLPAGLPVRIRGPGETPYFRQGDAVLPPVRLKELFGEFAARPIAGGYLQTDPAWVRRHIVTASVPLLGRVTCNRAIIPQVRGALAEIQRSGLGAIIDPGDFGGCYSSRFLNRNPESGVSHHAWGVAIDVNASANPFGRTPRQDPRVARIFERWGFTWGGNWLVPDGMHFEFVRFAAGA